MDVEAGRVRLDDPVARYLHEFDRGDRRHVTLLHLLTHTSGLPNWRPLYADPGDFVFTPRNQWHTFWNAGDTECRILEIISPSGFEHFFDELAELLGRDATPPEIEALAARYDHYYDFEKTLAVAKEYGLAFPMPE